jgi:hypothetical protein
LNDQPLKASDIRRYEVSSPNGGNPGLGLDGTVVVFNACGVAEAGPVLSLVGGWAEALMRGLFAGFVAPLWPVYEVAARDAMIAFFETARGGEVTLAEAVRSVRDSYGEASPSFLAFIYYGDVMARFPGRDRIPNDISRMIHTAN